MALTSATSNDPDLLKCFLNFPLSNIAVNNPVDLKWIHAQQNMATELVTKAAKYPKQYFNKLIDGCVIACHALPNEDCLTQWNISSTKEIVIPLLKRFHSILAHPGHKRSWMYIQVRFYHPDIRKKVDNFH